MGHCVGRETGFYLEETYENKEIEDMNQRIVRKMKL